jgi:NADH:ubiquinone oxidoreductase subunit 4 (subunit M)
MGISLILLLIYLVPLLAMQFIIMYERKKLTDGEIDDFNIISCIPIANIIFVAIYFGVCLNELLNRMNKK